MSKLTRRDFLKTSAAAAGVLSVGGGSSASPAAAKSATDWVELGSSGVRVTRLAFGTGTLGGRVQRELGQEGFTRLVRHAYDRGIRFFETSDSYAQMPGMLAAALKGLPRDSYRLMTKYRVRDEADPKVTIDRFRQELNSEYFDILLLHCVRVPDWSEQFKRLRDEFSEAKERKVILSHGASCHGLLPLRAFPGNRWLDVALMRVNHAGVKMDSVTGNDSELGDVDEVVSQVRKVHAQGTGVIGMKIIGEGRFSKPEERDASIRFVMKLGAVDSITIGYKSTAEIDEAIERVNTHLNS
jgi:aryl-alcohol dehydrogenase-like predicted oxidoreductase